MLTLNSIKKHIYYQDDWDKLLCSLNKPEADDEPLSLLTVLKATGLTDALCGLRALPPEMSSSICLLACDLAAPAMAYTDDKRVHRCLATARKYAVGKATAKELAKAGKAAKMAWAKAQAEAEAAWAKTKTMEDAKEKAKAKAKAMAAGAAMWAADAAYTAADTGVTVMAAAWVDGSAAMAALDAGDDITAQQDETFERWAKDNNL